VQPPQNRPRGASPFLLPCGRQVGSFVGVFLSWFEEKGKRKAREGNLLLPLPRASRGRRRPTVPFKTAPFRSLFFFLKQWMKQRRFTQNTPFYLKEMAQKTCQNPTQSSICNLFNQVLKCNFDFKYQFNCIPAKFNCRP